MMKTHTIDAAGKKLGRISTQAAMILMGKHSTAHQKHLVADVEVVIENAGKLSLNPKNLEDKKYLRYSLYPGGLKSETRAHVIEKKGIAEVVKRAVYGMLPANKLRPLRMKRLKIKE
jgi:large subunit ribosomal protein L13